MWIIEIGKIKVGSSEYEMKLPLENRQKWSMVLKSDLIEENMRQFKIKLKNYKNLGYVIGRAMKIGERWRIRVSVCWWVTARNEWVVRRRCTLGSATQIMIWFDFANPFFVATCTRVRVIPNPTSNLPYPFMFGSNSNQPIWLRTTIHAPQIARLSPKLPKILLFMGRFTHKSSKLHFKFS